MVCLMHMNSGIPRQIFVHLLDEPVEAWRPVQAIEKGDGLYKIVSERSFEPADEHWEFTTGDIVRVREQRFGEGRVELVAAERVGNPGWDA